MTVSFPTTHDAFLDGRISIRQPEKGFRSGLEAVFLAAACPAGSGDHVLEAGCGAGAASLCLLARVPGVKTIGIEIDPDLAQLANENAAANDVARDFVAIAASVCSPWSELEAKGVSRETFDHVIANPPFYIHGRARPAKGERNAASRAMGADHLDTWLRFLASACKPRGTCTLIHRAQALPELLRAMEGRFGDLRLIAVHPKPGSPALRIILRGRKGSRAPLTIAPGLVLLGGDGAPSKEAEAILRHGERLN